MSEMNSPTRRCLLGSGSAATAAVCNGPVRALAAMGPNDKFDLVIKGGNVLDPSQPLCGRRDIGIGYGLV
jgi:dihydroorotase